MDKQELFRKYLDEELSPAEEREALHAIADDKELRAALRFDFFLRQSFADKEFSKESFEVPEDFTNQVMLQIEKQENKKAVDSWASQLNEKISSWIENLLTPRSFQLRPALAVFLLMIVLLLPVVPFYYTQTETVEVARNNDNFQTQAVAESEEYVWVRFIYVDDNAENIAIAGDFNNWDPNSLNKQQINGQNVWTGFFSLPRGEHKYMFVVNGEEWVTDPLANTHQEDGFGNKNAILYL